MTFAREILPCIGKLVREGDRVLAIGPGSSSEAARVFTSLGCYVEGFDLSGRAETVHSRHTVFDMDFMESAVWKRSDLIWASHVLEHQRDPGLFLDRCFELLNEGGWLVVTVPPRKDQIVGGHVSLWNMGLLLYHLILAGFDCSQASCLAHGYNLTVAVQHPGQSRLPGGLVMDSPDLAVLERAGLWPAGLAVGKTFDGSAIEAINWPPTAD